MVWLVFLEKWDYWVVIVDVGFVVFFFVCEVLCCVLGRVIR